MPVLRGFGALFKTRGDILAETRIVAAAVPPFLILAFFILYVFPDSNGDYFAWPVRPRLTAMLLGATYLSGVFYFPLVLVSRNWRSVRMGFLPVTVFTWVMMFTTILNWDRFTHDHLAFWLWVALYFVTPFLLPWLWWRNSRHAGPLPAEYAKVVLPGPIRAALATSGVLALAAGVFLFCLPDVAADFWPWSITPLTARVLAAQAGLFGAFALAPAIEPRWEGLRRVLQTQMLMPVAYLGAFIFAWGDLDTSEPLAWVYVAGGSVFFGCGIPGMYLYMRSRVSTRS